MKIVREFWKSGSESGRRGDITLDDWFGIVFSEQEDFELLPIDTEDDVDLLIVKGGVYEDPEKAGAILSFLENRPDTKLCVLEGSRGPAYDFAKRRCLNVLNRTDAFLHNSTFLEKDLRKIEAASRMSVFRTADLNLFRPTDEEPLPLESRSSIVSAFGAVMHCKGSVDFADNFPAYANGRYAYGSVGHLMPSGNPRNEVKVFREFDDSVRFETDRFNLVGSYSKDDPAFHCFLRKTRFAVFCYGVDRFFPAVGWIESPEYSLLEAIDAGVPVIVHEDWLDSIRIFGEKPDLENTGFLTFRNWSDLGEERLLSFESEYEETIALQKNFLRRNWGKSAEEKLLLIFRELVYGDADT